MLKRADWSVAIFGIYLVLVCLGFFFIPNRILPLLGFATTTEVWIRLTGLLTGILGFYFLYGAQKNDVAFFWATICARLIFFGGVTGLVLFGFASPLFIAFGVIDLAGAAWTWWALKQG